MTPKSIMILAYHLMSTSAHFKDSVKSKLEFFRFTENMYMLIYSYKFLEKLSKNIDDSSCTTQSLDQSDAL